MNALLKPPSYILTDNALTVFFQNDDGKSMCHTLEAANEEFPNAVEAIKNADWPALIVAVTPKRVIIQSYLSETGDLVINGSEILYKGGAVPTNYTTQKIIEMHRQGLPIDPLLAFLEKLLQNPSSRAVDELLNFLEYGSMPITPDGCFLAYKRVRDDYKDVHSGKIDNSVGQTVTMPRNRVQDNPNITCSHGLHFCSREYLNHFGGDRVMVLKINPADVVSIPTDYNNTKGRCCAYEVVAELEADKADQHNWDGPVVSFGAQSDADYGDVDDDSCYHW